MYGLLTLILNLIRAFSLILVVYALLSWFPGAYDTPIGRFIGRLAAPFIKPFGHLNLRFGGLDWTVAIAIIVLNLVGEFVIHVLSSLCGFLP